MYALRHRAFAVAVVLVAAIAPALAQGVGVVSGRVTDERGVPMQGAVVTLTSRGVIGEMQAHTNAGGRYWLPGVPGGHELTIRASAEGRVPVQYFGHTARREGVTEIDFRLRPPGHHDVLVLVEEGVPYHDLALEGALSVIPGRVTTLRVSDVDAATARELLARVEDRPSAVLAIGETAARLAGRYVKDVPIVHAMVPAPADSDLITANMCGVPLNGGFEYQIEHLMHVTPGARRIGTLYDPSRMGRCLRDLKEAADAAGIEVVAAHVHGDGPERIAAGLDALRDEPLDAFFLLLDPRMIDAERFEDVARFAASREIILAVPDESLAAPGSRFSFVPGFRELGTFAGMLVRRIVEGKVQPSQIGMVFPDRLPTAMTATADERRSPRDLLPSVIPTRTEHVARETD